MTASSLRSRQGIQGYATRPYRRRPAFVQLRDSYPAGGFTLLELLIVLLIMAMIAGVAAPNLGRLYTSIQRQTERDYILGQFIGLGPMALRQGRSYFVPVAGAPGPSTAESLEPYALRLRATGAEPYAIDLPEGWTIDLSRPLVIGANGVCLGTELTLLRDGKVETELALEPPYCRIATDA